MIYRYQLFFIILCIYLFGVLGYTFFKDLYVVDWRMDSLAHDYHPEKYPILMLGDSMIRTDFKTDQVSDSVVDFLEKKSGMPVFDGSLEGLRPFAYADLLSVVPLNQGKAAVLFVEFNPIILAFPTDPEGYADWLKKIAITKKILSISEVMGYQLMSARSQLKPGEKLINEILDILNAKGDTKQIYDHFDILNEDCLLKIDGMVQSIVKEGRPRAKKIIFFIPPIDINYFKKYLEPAVYDSVKKRIAIIKDSVENAGCECLDLHDLLDDSKYFPDAYRMHLNDQGRERVAESLAVAI